MMKDFQKTELIGIDIEIVDAMNKNQVGTKGRIIDETKNTITIIKDSKKKRIIKDQIEFMTIYKGKKLRIKGRLLTKRSEDRIKSR